MNKKLLVSVFLCLFVFSLGMIALEKEEEKAPIIEHLFAYFSGRSEFLNHTYLESPTPLLYESETLFAFHVPASPKSDAIFFELGYSSYVWWWSGYSPQMFQAALYVRIVSEIIPDDIYIYNGGGKVFDVAITHPYNTSKPGQHSYKIILRKDGLLREFPDWWEVRYVDTNWLVPYEKANSILNDLIDNGFDVEAFTKGEVEGVKEFMLLTFYVDVTRAMKK